MDRFNPHIPPKSLFFLNFLDVTEDIPIVFYEKQSVSYVDYF